MVQEEIEKLFYDFNSKKIIVIGDVMIDHYLWGKVERISPEAPVPVVTYNKEESRLGGAANVALNILALGAKPLLCSMLGNDHSAETFKTLMMEAGLSTFGLLVDETRHTSKKTRVIGGTQQLLRIDRENDAPLSAQLTERLIIRIKEMLEKEKPDAIIFQDYDKGVITPHLIDEIIEVAKKKNVPTLVDPKKRNFNHYHHVSLFKPNFKEFSEGHSADCQKDNPESLFKASKLLHTQQNIQTLMVTLSEKGIFISKKEEYFSFPAQIRAIADVSGAGDTVISVAGLCLACGLDNRQIAVLSNLAGGLVCEKVGVVPIDKELFLKESISLQNQI